MVDQNAAALDAVRIAREALQTAQLAPRTAELAAGGLTEPTSADIDTHVIEELTVKRINLVEDDGRLRMIIGNSTHAQVAPMRGQLRAHPERAATAGLLFINDDGTECGLFTVKGVTGAGAG